MNRPGPGRQRNGCSGGGVSADLAAAGNDGGREIRFGPNGHRRTRCRPAGPFGIDELGPRVSQWSTAGLRWQDREIRIWDIVTREIGTVLSIAPQTSRYFGIAVAPAGKTVVSAGAPGDVRVWQTLGNQNVTEPVLTNSGQ